MQIRRILLICLFFSCSLSSCQKVDPYVEKVKRILGRDSAPKQVVGLPDEEKVSHVPPPPEPVKMEPVIDKTAKVAILGYHDFTESRRPTQMIMDVDEFRAQMKAIKDSEIPVISMQDFLDWRNEKKNIPAESIMITIDDGWKDTHTLAMPILKEFGFPFAVFLYQKYVGVGGRSMTHSEIRELIENGGTVCSHSVSHRNMAKPPGRTAEEKEAWLKAEFEDSHSFLAENFLDGVLKTFAFPYGIYNDKVMESARAAGYEACFTVSPGKTTWETDLMKINRYIVHGTSASTFNAAINFGGGGTSATGRKLLSEQRDKKTGAVKEPLIKVYPPSGSLVRNRLPRIEVNLAAMGKVQSDSIVMRVSGLGRVPHRYDSGRKVISYQFPQRLRLDNCGVQVSFRHSGKRDKEVIGWNFRVDKTSEYLSADATVLRPTDQPVDPEADLVLPKKKVEASAEMTKTSQTAQDSVSADLLDPVNTIN